MQLEYIAYLKINSILIVSSSQSLTDHCYFSEQYLLLVSILWIWMSPSLKRAARLPHGPRCPAVPERANPSSNRGQHGNSRASHPKRVSLGTNTFSAFIYLSFMYLHVVPVLSNVVILRFGEDIPGMEGLGTGMCNSFFSQNNIIIYNKYYMLLIMYLGHLRYFFLSQILTWSVHGRRTVTWSYMSWPSMALYEVTSCSHILLNNILHLNMSFKYYYLYTAISLVDVRLITYGQQRK